MTLAESIMDLRDKGMSYKEIKDELGCAKSTVSYHLGKGQKEKNKERRKLIPWYNIRHIRRIDSFKKSEAKPKMETKRAGQKSISEKASEIALNQRLLWRSFSSTKIRSNCCRSNL